MHRKMSCAMLTILRFATERQEHSVRYISIIRNISCQGFHSLQHYVYSFHECDLGSEIQIVTIQNNATRGLKSVKYYLRNRQHYNFLLIQVGLEKDLTMILRSIGCNILWLPLKEYTYETVSSNESVDIYSNAYLSAN